LRTAKRRFARAFAVRYSCLIKQECIFILLILHLRDAFFASGKEQAAMRYMTSLRFIDVVAREGSIRKAADKLAITSTALNRRILAIEDELGQPLFERLPGGVRLNTAGELFIQHVRSQFAELARVQSQISDLTGIRRGHVRIASGADALRLFLPQAVSQYRALHPAVTFALQRCYGESAEAQLQSLDADIALIFAPIRAAHVHVAATVRQTMHCVMPDDHPLSRHELIRIRDLAGHKLCLPTSESGIRQLLDAALLRRGTEIDVVLESDSFEFMQNYLRFENALGFQIPIALTDLAEMGLVARPLDPADVAPGTLHLCYLKGRVLPVAAAKFLDEIITSLRDNYGEAVDQ
jgi:DNA-binding transcriptional LysR family regulator